MRSKVTVRQIRQAAYCFATHSWGRASGLGLDSGSCTTASGLQRAAREARDDLHAVTQAFPVTALIAYLLLEADLSDMAVYQMSSASASGAFFLLFGSWDHSACNIQQGFRVYRVFTPCPASGPSLGRDCFRQNRLSGHSPLSIFCLMVLQMQRGIPASTDILA